MKCLIIKWKRLGEHIHVALFIDHVLTGMLVLREPEYDALCDLLAKGAEARGVPFGVYERDADIRFEHQA
jgi:hypothetical protein